MSYCVECGLPIPSGQHTCSMCYGDPWHGRDGYYMAELEREWLEEDAANLDAALAASIWSELDESEAMPLGERPNGFNGYLTRYEDIPY